MNYYDFIEQRLRSIIAAWVMAGAKNEDGHSMEFQARDMRVYLFSDSLRLEPQLKHILKNIHVNYYAFFFIGSEGFNGEGKSPDELLQSCMASLREEGWLYVRRFLARYFPVLFRLGWL